jgi:hypothetical protein
MGCRPSSEPESESVLCFLKNTAAAPIVSAVAPRRLRKRISDQQHADAAVAPQQQDKPRKAPATGPISALSPSSPSTIPFPNLQVGAQLEQALHADGSTAEGAAGWKPPRPPRVTVVASLKEDPLGRTHARIKSIAFSSSAVAHTRSFVTRPSAAICAALT